MISTSLFFALRPTPGGELDLWEEIHDPRIVRRPQSRIGEKYWQGHRIYQKPLFEFCEKLFKEFGIKYKGYHLGTIDLSSKRLGAFYERMLELQEMVYFEMAALQFVLTDDETTPCEWFILTPKDSSDSIENRFEEGERCRADRMPTNVHAVCYDFVSESFKQVVEEESYSGVEFIWLQDTGKKYAPQWFRVIAREPIGRGLDHDWFDPLTLTGKHEQTTNPHERCGVTDFQQKQFKEGVGFGDPVKDGLISLMPPNVSCIDGLSVRSYKRMLRATLPKTDFAFIWAGERGLRQACFNRRVRDSLVSKGILSAEECEPVMIVDSAPPGVLVLDGDAPYPPPYEPIERLEPLRIAAAAAWAEFSANRIAKSAPPSMEQVLKSMSNLAKQGFHEFDRGATLESIRRATKALPLELPTVWGGFLARVNGARIYGVFGDLILQAAEHLEGCHGASCERGLEHDPDFPLHLLHVGLTGEGDVISLDTSKLTNEGDCAVVLISHETFEASRTWPSIPEFLQEVIESAAE